MAIPAGYTPLDYVGFTDRGAYANNVTYVINDIVDYRGEKWKCKVTNTIGVTPGENANWTIWMGAPVNLVERIIAPLEENPATIAYGVGRQIIYDDYLFEVIKQINVGDTLVVYDPLNPSPSANIKLAPPVETQVLAIKAEADATDDMIAPTETNASASSQPYGVGEQLILNNVLYTVTSAIAQNDPLVISGAGQNLTASKSLTDQLADKADSDVMDGALALKANKTDIARIEGATMSKGYAVGEQFYHGGMLYTALKAIANEAAWSSLVEDTDYGESTVNARLKNINDALDSEIITRSSQIQALTNNKQNKNLSSSIAGQTTVEGLLGLFNSQLEYRELSNGYTVDDLIDDAKDFSSINFTNWVDNTNFPEIYGSGIIFKCKDPRNLFVLYVANNGHHVYSAVINGVDTATRTFDWTKISNDLNLYGSMLQGNTEAILPSKWEEIVIQVMYTSGGDSYNIVSRYLSAMMTTSYMNVSLGNYGTSYFAGKLSKGKFKVTTANFGGTDVLANVRTYLYIR